MIDAIGHVLELPVAVVPAAFVHDVLGGVRAHRSRALQLTAVLVHLDRPLLPCLLLSCRQFPPLERKWFYVLCDQSRYVTRKPWQTVGKTILTFLKVVRRTVSMATLFFMRDWIMQVTFIRRE